MAAFRTLDDLGDIRGKRVLLRVDLNVPMRDGRVTDATRLEATRASIGELTAKGAVVLCLAHFGRPKGKHVPEMSLAPVAPVLAQVLNRPVAFIDQCHGAGAEAAVARLQPGQVAVLENT
ncbi:MAG: phosphoglycerate kinase, partial [Alphaproteobacteria bacterium]